MNKNYDVLDDTLFPTIQPAIASFGLPQVPINIAVERLQHHERPLKQASASRPTWPQRSDAVRESPDAPNPEAGPVQNDQLGATSAQDLRSRMRDLAPVDALEQQKVAVSAGLISGVGGAADMVLRGLSYLARGGSKAVDRSVQRAVDPQALFGSRLTQNAVYKGLGTLDETDLAHLYSFGALAPDAQTLGTMLQHPQARGINATARDALTQDPQLLAQLHLDAHDAQILEQHRGLFQEVGSNAHRQVEHDRDTHPLSLLATGAGTVGMAAGIYDFINPEEPEMSWYQTPAGVAGIAGGSALLGAGAMIVGDQLRERRSVLPAPAQKQAGIGTVITSGLSSLLGAGSSLYHTPARFATRAAEQFGNVDPADIERIAQGFSDYQRKNLPARAGKVLGLMGTGGAVISGAQSMIARRERERQQEEFRRNLPRFIAGATATGVALGGLGNHLSQRALDRAMASPAPAPKPPEQGY